MIIMLTNPILGTDLGGEALSVSLEVLEVRGEREYIMTDVGVFSRSVNYSTMSPYGYRREPADTFFRKM